MAASERFFVRQRAPRVQIDYEVETYGALQRVTLPFVIGVVGDFVGDSHVETPPLRDRVFREIDADNFDLAMSRFAPRVSFTIPSSMAEYADGLAVDLTFRSREDLAPGHIAYQVPPLAKLLAERNRLALLRVQLDGNLELEDLLGKLVEDEALLRAIQLEARQREGIDGASDDGFQIKEEGAEVGAMRHLIRKVVPGLSEHARESLEEGIVDFVRIAGGTGNPVRILAEVIHGIDCTVGEQLEHILHHPKFQALEATWRGLWYLVGNTATGPDLKIRMLPARKGELQRMARQYRDAAWDSSPLFKQIYEAEFGQLGGQPFGIIICDYAFDHSAPDIDLLRTLSQIGASAHVPMIAQAAPSLMGFEDWSELGRPRDIARIFDAAEYAGWRQLRQRPDSRYLVLTVPRVLGRSTYGDRLLVEEFDFQEKAESADAYLWINAAFALAVRIAEAHSSYGWYARIRGVEFGGTVDGLPVILTYNEDGTINVRGPTEIPVTDRRESELASAGLVPLLSRKNTDSATFLSAETVHAALQYTDAEATLRARLSAQLPYVLVVSRFAHYLKCMTRDWVGSFRSPEEVEHQLNSWIAQYVDGQPETSSAEMQARLPLRAGTIEVRSTNDGPSTMVARMTIDPHYQFASTTSPSLSIAMQLLGHR